jgi:hypothetical protein
MNWGTWERGGKVGCWADTREAMHRSLRTVPGLWSHYWGSLPFPDLAWPYEGPVAGRQGAGDVPKGGLLLGALQIIP